MKRPATLQEAMAHARYMAIMSRDRMQPATGQHTTGVAVSEYDHLGIFAYYSPAQQTQWQIRLWHPLRLPHRAELDTVAAVFGPDYIWHESPVNHTLSDLRTVPAIELAGALFITPSEMETTKQWIEIQQNYQFPAKHRALKLLAQNS